MNKHIIEKFILLWKKYFDGAELPVIFYYTNEEGHARLVEPDSVPGCVIGILSEVRKGRSLCFNVDSVGCPGGKRYLGFTEGIMPDFEYFLSYGIPGKLTGERYCKSPELVKEIMKRSPTFKAPGRFIIFKRWDKLEESDDPEVVIFFAEPDVLSGLFTLARFDETEQNAVFTPFGSGCSTIVQYPYLERDSARPRGVIGMFDPSARPFVPNNVLTFSVPMNKFVRMIENMEESFLITDSWRRIQKRLK
ncbi:MAG: hypothetical protein COW22_01890 [Chloroflexi bacterium CG15_BIG_FIL_POST_REV_8_21_14_020_46_15]|nr:MAG: hypothetical protein COW22_01890 [Chloroflexi bacterium CG15_BIG_FIL_POST_REV_8_21_14_020_46_15]